MGVNYSHSSLLKRNRKWLLTQIEHLCFCCGGKARQTHHLDWERTNHEIENLLPVCTTCHGKLHAEHNRESITAKIKSKIKSMVKMKINLLQHFSIHNHYGLSECKFNYLEREGKLNLFIKLCSSLPQTLTKEELDGYYREAKFTRSIV